MKDGTHEYFTLLERYLVQAERTLEIGAGCGMMSIEAVLQAGVKEAWAADISAEATAYVYNLHTSDGNCKLSKCS